MIKREQYLQKIIPFIDKLLKVITGIGRCGELLILKTIYKRLSTNKSNNLRS